MSIREGSSWLFFFLIRNRWGAGRGTGCRLMVRKRKREGKGKERWKEGGGMESEAEKPTYSTRRRLPPSGLFSVSTRIQAGPSEAVSSCLPRSGPACWTWGRTETRATCARRRPWAPSRTPPLAPSPRPCQGTRRPKYLPSGPFQKMMANA